MAYLLPLFAEILADEGVQQFPLEILATLAVEILQKPATLRTESPLTRQNTVKTPLLLSHYRYNV